MYEKENFDDFVCTRCNHKVRKRIKNSLQVSLALTICAILLYIPAMIYPIMEVTTLGVKVESTILEGVISFLDMESYFIAIVIFTASVVIPMIKLIGLLFIFISLKINVKMQNNRKILIFKFIINISCKINFFKNKFFGNNFTYLKFIIKNRSSNFHIIFIICN